MTLTHPLRTVLHDEIHARPRPPVAAPHAVAHASLLRSPRAPNEVPAALVVWCQRCGLAPPAPGVSHFDAEYGQLHLKWELHGEFEDYTVYVPNVDPAQPFAPNAADAVLAALLATEMRPIIAALRVAILPAGLAPAPPPELAAWLETQALVGAQIADKQAALYSSFRLDEDGFGRFLVVDAHTQPSQLGRHVQRVIELEVYRMMAMLTFPEARRIAGELDRIELQLAELVARLNVAPARDEPHMLQAITRLSAMVEQLATVSAFRFGAARAYRALVQQRGDELRENRLPGLQTPTEFLRRRFQPAMAFCEAVATRLDSVAERIARASALLGTRVEIERERHNQALLEAMNRRAKLQLHLQQTVEGLSVAAISYYSVGLAAYLWKALAHLGMPIDPELATGVSLVPIVLTVAWAVRSIRQRVVAPLAGDL